MVDYRKLLDAFIGALGRPEQQQQNAQGGAGAPAERSAGAIMGQSPDQLLQKAKDLATQNPGLTQAALLGLAGLVFGRRKKRGLTGSLVKLGGLAVIGGLAYKAYQSRQGGQGIVPAEPAQDRTGASAPPAEAARPERVEAPPETSRFHPVSQTEDDALLFLRTMVAAAAADGQIDQAERARIVKGLAEAGIDPQASRWLDGEMASPADVEELASAVNDSEKAAQVYAAARIAIDPDTIQEREFLNRLAGALDLEEQVRAEIDDTADAVR
ncbi:tellurite resistance TerB family protein [Microvirga roseola]|uniref:tellurite resistance TerB family protein n=1 Tax=Microvirga roseola TaxID=2883126 RepID=UPI001E2F8CDC|nr:DUF533 domain-containing protein [Microvirga roseola]